MKQIKTTKKIRVLLWAVFSFFVLMPSAFAQQNEGERKITGTVKDDKGNPLGGATVEVKNTKVHTVTNSDGVFSINLPVKAKTLVISNVGQTKKEIDVTTGNVFEVSLVALSVNLNEVVVIGYGTAKRSSVSSSISSVSSKDIKDLAVAGVDQALQGKVAGVSITNNSGQPGGGVSIKVRGVTSINSNDPLIVIDGVPFVSNTKSNSGYSGIGGSDGQTGNSVMATLNPGDIESVDVLKDASAQAIYGSQAANGVILITTKRGKNGDGKITYDTYYGHSQITKKLDLMNLREFAQYQNEVVSDLGIDSTTEFDDPSILGVGTDWQDAMFKNGQMQNHQLSFSGGKDKTNYYLSLNYFNQTGILIGSDFKRYTTRFSLDHQLKSWFKIGVSSNATRNVQNVTLADAAEGTIWWGAIQNPVTPVKNIDGTWGGGQTVGSVEFGQDNPIARSLYRGSKSVSSQVFGNVYGEIQFFKGLSFRNEVSYSLGLNNNSVFQKAATIGRTATRSQYYDSRSNSYYYALRNYMNYNKNIGDHAITATAGHEAQYSYYEGINGKKLDLQNNILDLNAGSNDRTTWDMGGGKGEWSMESFFARATYAYDNRYALSTSIRADGSSNFGPNNKWGYFPGASFAWTVSNEHFAEKMKKVVNYLKLRIGYGAVGNQNLPWGAPNPAYTSAVGFWGPVGFGNSSYLNGIENKDLSWESVITQNLGVDVSFLNGRIDLTVDVYKKTTTDMLLFKTGGTMLGIGENWDDLKAPIGNVGHMSNTGIDISLVTNNINNKNLTWKTNIIFSQYKNKLEKMAASTSGLIGKVYYDRYSLTYTNPGYAVGSFYGLVTDGIFRTQEDLNKSIPQLGYSVDSTHTWLGDVRFKDINGDGAITSEDITYIGSPLPKFTYGITNSFQFKNIDVALFVQGSYGAKIYNFLRMWLEGMNTAGFNQMRSVKDRYTTANPQGSLPRFTRTNTNNGYVSDRFIEDGSYLRIQNLTIGYRLPKKIIGKALMSNARIYFSVQNLYTFSKYSGYDPEIGAYNNNIRLMNVDAGHYPNPRTFTAGVNIEF